MHMSEPAESHTPSRVLERTEPLRASGWSRVLAGGLAIACLAVLSMGAWLNPSNAGHGTHTQLGLKPCLWAVALDKPCMTCGMTTSFAHAGEGDWLQSFLNQPMGSLLVVLTSVMFWCSATQAFTGARIGTMVQPMLRPRLFIVFTILMLLAWGYKALTW
jgi:hypothetical protein